MGELWYKMAQQCRQCVVTGCSSTAVDVPVTWRYVYCISASSAFMTLKARRAVRMQLNADVEFSFLATQHVVEWRPTAGTVPPNVYLGMFVSILLAILRKQCSFFFALTSRI